MAPPKEEPITSTNDSASDFKSSLGALLQKGNPLSLPGGIRRGTTMNKKPVATEEEAPKQQIKFDIFNEEDGNKGGNTANVTDYKNKTVLDNVRLNYTPLKFTLG